MFVLKRKKIIKQKNKPFLCVNRIAIHIKGKVLFIEDTENLEKDSSFPSIYSNRC